MKYMLLALLAFLPATAYAEEKKLDPAACTQLSAAYVPGVDAYGRPVVPADIEEQPQMPEKFSFDITVDVARASGLPVPYGVEMQGKIGTITYEKGVLSFNGKPLSQEEAEKLKAQCPPAPEESKKDAD